MADSRSVILIVDDDDDLRMLRRESLEREGFKVVEAVNGREGVEAAISERPRLILMNCAMPVMDGLQATEEIRRQRGLEKVPILMISLYEKKEMLEKALAAGCNDYLEEPCFPREMMKNVMANILVG